MEVDIETNPKGEAKPEGSEEKGKIILLMLVGAPGSGKSTFCESVMRASTRPWVRICQDTIGNGKAGNKSQCIASASTALKDGKSVFIDRCNLDREQRSDFLKLGCLEVDVHAVVLDLPAKLCIARSVKRTGHEGNLQGGKAASVVNRMLQKKELPKLGEGFSRIVFCQNENDVGAASKTYSALGPSESLPSGCFGQKKSDSKVQQGIMKFLKKVEPPVNEAPGKSKPHGSESGKISAAENTSSSRRLEKVDCISNAVSSSNNTSLAEGIPTLAFPSISTADFQFSHEKASDIIVEKVQEFVNTVQNFRLVLVDLSHGSKILSLVKDKAAEKNIDTNRFFTFVGDITQLYTKGGLRCNVIANATNWRLKPGGGGVNAAIFHAAGPALEVATKERAGSLLPGRAVVVPLPETSPLLLREGVTHVIHVLGPNMNPQRPNYLNNDYVKGGQVLREAYSSLFEGFASITKNQEESPRDPIPKNDHKIKREGVYESERNKKSKGAQIEVKIDNAASRDEEDKIQKGKSWGSWAQALYNIAMDPEKHKSIILEISDDFVVLNDLYPKAQRHLLVLARCERLNRLGDVCKEHLELLKTMHDTGLKWAENFLLEDASLVFRLGYHSVPSMPQLHLHVISQDFDSNHLKNKKHWNSFNTAFFRDSVDVIKEVTDNGKATLNNESLLSMELRCHRCRSAHPNIPKLKSHISNCRAPFPRDLLQNGRLVLAPDKVDMVS